MRFLIFALFMVLASNAIAQESGNTEDGGFVEGVSQQQADEGGRTTEDFSLPVRIIESPEETERTKRREDNADRREEQDLVAQTSMAVSTRELIKVSWWQTRLAAGGTILVFVSLCFSAWAAHSAVEANRITREHFAAENRPWIRFDGDIDLGIYSDEYDSGTMVVKCRVKNEGKTPAESVAVHVSVGKMPLLFMDSAGTKEFAESTIVKAGRDLGARVIFPSDNPTELNGFLSDIPDVEKGKTMRAIVCVTYRASGLPKIYYSAIAVRFRSIEAEGWSGEGGESSFETISSSVVSSSEAMI